MKRLILLLLLGLTLPVAWAGREDDERRRGEPRVILYQHADYRGDSLVLYPGESIDNLSGRSFPNGGGLNDSVSSIRLEGGAEVLVYENARFRGQVLRLTESARDLTLRYLPDAAQVSWNDRISSIQVEQLRRRPGERPVDPNLAIGRVYQDLLGRAPDAAGLRYYRGLMIDQGWTENMVRDHIRQGEEFRREAADRIVRRAYQDLLGREPDEGGLRNYRKMVLERNLTENELRDIFRRSPEYLNRTAAPRPDGRGGQKPPEPRH